MLTGRSYTTSLGRPCLRESEASAGEFPLVFDGLGVFRGHFYRVIDFPNPRQNCHRTTNRKLMLKIFPYLEHVRIDLAWGGPMACSANLFPQIGSLSGRPNAFFVQGYSGFGVTPSHIVCKVLAEGMSEGSARYDLLSSVRRIPIHGKDHFRPLLLSAGKTWHQLSGYWNGRR